MSKADASASLVVIEGARFTGKSSVAQGVCDALRSKGVATARFFPTPPMAGMGRWASAVQYASQRALFAASLVGSKGVFVCDGWWHSAHVEALRLSDTALGTLCRAEEIGLPAPRLVVVLNAPNAVLNARRGSRSVDLAVETERRSIYREASGDARVWAPREGAASRLVVVDSSGPVATTVARVLAEVLAPEPRESPAVAAFAAGA